jgi:hypothetical protein
MRRVSESDHELLEGALDRLYRAPPARFVAERKAIVVELRARAATAASAEVARARRPTPTAWALNQVAHASPKIIRAFGDAVEELRSAQARAFKTGGDDASRFAAARADLKERTRDVVQAVREVMSMEGLAWTREAQRRVARTLHAVPFASPEDRARLFAGRLDRDLEAAADFGSLAGGAPTERERDEEKTNNRIERPKGEKKKKKGEMQERAARARAQGEATARARRESAERARVEAKERALVRARDARMKKILASAQAAQSEADRLEAQAANAEKRAAKARLAADAARAAAVKAREAAAEASTKAAEALLALSQGSRAFG